MNGRLPAVHAVAPLKGGSYLSELVLAITNSNKTKYLLFFCHSFKPTKDTHLFSLFVAVTYEKQTVTNSVSAPICIDRSTDNYLDDGLFRNYKNMKKLRE